VLFATRDAHAGLFEKLNSAVPAISHSA